MPKHNHSVLINVDVNTAFDLATHYFNSRGFAVVDSIKPTFIRLQRGGVWTADTKSWVTKKCDVEVQFKGDTQKTTIFFTYDISVWLWEGEKDISQINMEVEGLKNLILSTIQQSPKPQQTRQGQDRICVKCQRQIPWDANLCPYCGHDYRQKGEGDKQ